MLHEQTTLSVSDLKIDKTVRNLQQYEWHYVKYTNMEDFCRDSHILCYTTVTMLKCPTIMQCIQNEWIAANLKPTHGIYTHIIHTYTHICTHTVLMNICSYRHNCDWNSALYLIIHLDNYIATQVHATTSLASNTKTIYCHNAVTYWRWLNVCWSETNAFWMEPIREC